MTICFRCQQALKPTHIRTNSENLQFATISAVVNLDHGVDQID